MRKIFSVYVDLHVIYMQDLMHSKLGQLKNSYYRRKGKFLCIPLNELQIHMFYILEKSYYNSSQWVTFISLCFIYGNICKTHRKRFSPIDRNVTEFFCVCLSTNYICYTLYFQYEIFYCKPKQNHYNSRLLMIVKVWIDSLQAKEQNPQKLFKYTAKS